MSSSDPIIGELPGPDARLIKLTGGRKHGTFKGTTLDLKPGSGTFSC